MMNQSTKYWISAILIFLAFIFLTATIFLAEWQLLLILSLLFFSLYKVFILYTRTNNKSPIKDLFRFLFISSNEGWADISKFRKKDGSFINYTRRDKLK